MPPLYRAHPQPPTRRRVVALLLLVLATRPATADAIFDAAASHSPPPPGATSVGEGTGFFVTGDGVLLTAAHLVQGCRRIDVAGTPDAALLASNPDADVATLRVPARTPALRLARHAPAQDGPLTIQTQAPEALRATSLNRQARQFDRNNPAPDTELILQATIRHGDSGAPILNHGGEVIGLVQGILPDAGEVKTSYGLSRPNIAVGPGLAPLRAAVAELALEPGRAAVASGGSAVVGVVCWR